MSDYKRLVITHKNCMDGQCCQAIFKDFFKNESKETEYIEIDHKDYDLKNFPENYQWLNEKILAYKGKEVHMADICLPYEMLEKIINNKNSLTVIDHHIFVKETIDKIKNLKDKGFPINVSFSEKNTESGAKLTWNTLLPNQPIPDVVEYVSDGDLYQFNHKETKPFYLGILEGTEGPKDINPEVLINLMKDKDSLNKLIESGISIVERNRLEIEELSKNKEKIIFNGIEGYLCYSPAKHKSDLGNYLALENGTYAILWDERDGLVKVSFRSVAPFSVIPLAEVWGGGGHAQASGATIKGFDEFLEKLREQGNQPVLKMPQTQNKKLKR